MRILKFILAAALSAASLPATSAAGADKADVLATVKQFDNSFNTGDIKGVLAKCAPNATILDDFPPHVWQGSKTCQDWMAALDTYDKKNGITEGIVTIGQPWRVTITGDRAYVVVPTKYAYKQNGKPVIESGAVWTLALQKSAGGWLVTAWAWAQH